MPHRAWVSWSSGKDATMALAAARADPDLEVVGLLTTLDESSGRVAVHDVRRALLDAQADALGLPLHVVGLPWPCPDEEYTARMAATLGGARSAGVTRIVFGDLLLADVRAFRERSLVGTGVDPVFPLWQRPTGALAAEMLAVGVRGILACVDTRRLEASWAGRPFDAALLADLPAQVDPCGENGEFHTVVTDGPGFAHPLRASAGPVTVRDGFAYTDVVPDPPTPPRVERAAD